MKSKIITFANIFIVLFTHIIAFVLLYKFATKHDNFKMGNFIFIVYVPFLSSFIWSSVIVNFITKVNKETYLQVILWYAVFGIFCHSIIAYFAESYLWTLLIIPYLLFIGQGFYLKYENKFDNQSKQM